MAAPSVPRPLRAVAAVSAFVLAISACGARPELICTYETFETCEAAATAALDAVNDRSSVTSVTIKPPDGTWRRDGADYLALAMVQSGNGDVTVLRVTGTDDEPMRAEIIRLTE